MVTGIGIFILFVGAMALVGGLVQKMRVGRLGDTPFGKTGEVASNGRALANPKGAISTEGQLVTEQILNSPISGTPCLYYKTEIRAKWKNGDKELDFQVQEERQAVRFAVNDGTGPAIVNIDPKRGGEFASKYNFQNKKFSRGLIGSIAGRPLEITPIFSIPGQVYVQGAMGRQIEVPTHAAYYVTEEVLEPKPFFYVNGKLQDDGTIGSPSWASLLIKDKTRDDLVAGAAGFSKKLFIGGGITAPIGAIVAIIGYLTAPAVSAAPAEAGAAAAPIMAPAAASPLTHSLTFGGACTGINLTGGNISVIRGGEGINISAVRGTVLNRVLVQIPPTSTGTVEVCRVGSRCDQMIQFGDATTTYLNSRGTTGSLNVRNYNVGTGQMDIEFQDVHLPAASGGTECVVNGSISTTQYTM